MIKVASNPVRISALLLLVTLPSIAQDSRSIEFIDFYGLRTVSEATVRAVLPFQEGDILEDMAAVKSLGPVLAARLGVASVELSIVCCSTAGSMIVYVGISETAATGISFLPAPTGNAVLRLEILEAYEAFDKALFEAVTAGDAGEDDSAGHAVANNPVLRVVQERFLNYARDYRDEVVLVLHESNNATHRAGAALVIGYALDKRWAAQHLEEAAFDADEGVRNNAIRGLAVIAGYAGSHPELGIKINYERFIDLLSSPVWSDRNKGLFVLFQAVRDLDEQMLVLMSERALPSLIEMCRWHVDGHAMPACVLLARALGLPVESVLKDKQEIIAAGWARLNQDSE